MYGLKNRSKFNWVLPVSVLQFPTPVFRLPASGLNPFSVIQNRHRVFNFRHRFFNSGIGFSNTKTGIGFSVSDIGFSLSTSVSLTGGLQKSDYDYSFTGIGFLNKRGLFKNLLRLFVYRHSVKQPEVCLREFIFGHRHSIKII